MMSFVFMNIIKITFNELIAKTHPNNRVSPFKENFDDAISI